MADRRTAPQLTDADWRLIEALYNLTEPQRRLVTTQARYPAFVGGFGSGKTSGLVARTIVKKLCYWQLSQAYYLPTYDLVRQIAFPRFTEALAAWGIDHKLNRNDNEITFPDGSGRIIFRTMDRPERIVGYEVADSCVDELDTLKPEDAQEVWNKIIARTRQKKPDGAPNTAAVGTTPEGFRFVYDRWQRNAAPGYELIQAPTNSNALNLPEGYIETLKASYPSQLLAAYLEGEFVNLKAGSVYPEFDRAANHTDEGVQQSEPLHVGMDFNVANMAATVCVQRGGEPRAVEELVGLRDTPQMIDALKARYPGHSITVYPDQSGGARKSVDASTSDLALLKQAGFRVHKANQNPKVRDRVLAVNRMVAQDGTRRLLVNTDACPQLTMSLEQQAYDKNGEPDKTNGFDHIVDALGYYITARYPVRGHQPIRAKKVGGF